MLHQNQKFNLLSKYNIDFVISKKFNKNFSKTRSITFIKEILQKKLNAKFIFVSNNFRFGYKREGSVKQLIKLQNECRYKIVKPFEATYKAIKESPIIMFLDNLK